MKIIECKMFVVPNGADFCSQEDMKDLPIWKDLPDLKDNSKNNT